LRYQYQEEVTLSHQITPMFIEEHTEDGWEDEQEHLFCCTPERALCGESFADADDYELTVSCHYGEIACRLCYSIGTGEFPWRCPTCDCTEEVHCGQHL
jgi:hypothetical protein